MRPFRSYLHEMEDLLQECVRQAEAQEWHHLPVESPEFQHYLRLCTFAQEATERRQRFESIKEGRFTRRAWRQFAARAEEAHRLERYPNRPHLDVGVADSDNVVGGDRSSQGGHGTLDLGQDDYSVEGQPDNSRVDSSDGS